MTTPTKPGFYWAKWRIAEDGSETVIGDLTPSNRWEVVEVEYDNFDNEQLIVSVAGEPRSQSLENFFWGPGPLEPPP